MDIVKQGFLIKKQGKINVNHKVTNSIFLNKLQVDFLLRNRQYIKGYLLDAGCGEKPYSLIYDELVEKSIGCDVEYCIHDQKEVDVFASLDDLPFENEMFDTVLCTNVLEHVAEYQKAFSELARVLKCNGYMIISLPFLYPLHEEPHDFYRYSFYGLKYQIEKNGLNIINVTPWGGVGAAVFVYFNLFLCKFLKVSLLNAIGCTLQEVIYTIYKKISLNRLIKQGIDRKITKVISTGYFIIAEKCND